jgi:hypothetical protein
MPNFAFPPAAVPAEIPGAVRLQIVSPSTAPPDGDDWLHEVEHDGHRLIAIVAHDELQLISRYVYDRTLLFRSNRSRAFRAAAASARDLPSERPWSSASSLGQYEGAVRVPKRAFRGMLDGSLSPRRCLETFHLQRTRFEMIVEGKLRRRQFTDDGNVEITGRDLCEKMRPPGQCNFFHQLAV